MFSAWVPILAYNKRTRLHNDKKIYLGNRADY